MLDKLTILKLLKGYKRTASNDINVNEIRSRESSEKSYLRFLNLTKFTLEIIWINFTGKYVRYQLLRRGEYIDINTYKSHPWLALDVRTKDRMLIDKQFIYMPKTYREYVNSNPNLRYPVVGGDKRKLICITTPLYSLRYRTLLNLRNYFKTDSEVDGLDLPQSLLDDLKKVINLRNKQINTYFCLNTSRI